MIDGAIRTSIEEQIRFYVPGGFDAFDINGCEIEVVRLHLQTTDLLYLAVCRTCAALVADHVEFRRVVPAMLTHAEKPPAPDPNDSIPTGPFARVITPQGDRR